MVGVASYRQARTHGGNETCLLLYFIGGSSTLILPDSAEKLCGRVVGRERVHCSF